MKHFVKLYEYVILFLCSCLVLGKIIENLRTPIDVFYKQKPREEN